MSAPFIRLPGTIYKDMIYGDISLLQFHILLLFYRRVQNWNTNMVQGMSADLIIDELEPLGLIPKSDDRKTRRRYVQRAAQGLRPKYYNWDYVEGSKRPYTIWLSVSRRHDQTQMSPVLGGLNVADLDDANVAENPSVNQADPNTSQEPLFDNVAENVPANVADELSLTCRGRVADMSPNTHIRIQPRSNAAQAQREDASAGNPSPTGTPCESLGDKPNSQGAGSETQRDDAEILGAYVFELTKCQPPSERSVRDLLKRFNIGEIKLAFEECVDGKNDKTLVSSVRLFFSGGAPGILRLQKQRMRELADWFPKHFTSTTRIQDLESAALKKHLLRETDISAQIFDRALDLWLDEKFPDADRREEIANQLYQETKR